MIADLDAPRPETVPAPFSDCRRPQFSRGGLICPGTSPGQAEGHAALRQLSQNWGGDRQGEYENMTHLLSPAAREAHRRGAVGRPAGSAVWRTQHLAVSVRPE